jgi:hypothetical protein
MTEPNPQDLPAVAARLIVTIDGLTKAIELLMDRADATEKKVDDTEKLAQTNTQRVKKNERKAHTIRVLVIMDILFTVLGFLFGYYIFYTNGRIDAVCPLYSWAIGSYAPQTRSPGPDRDQYIQWSDMLRDKFSSLDCGPAYPLVPGAAHPPAAAPPN